MVGRDCVIVVFLVWARYRFGKTDDASLLFVPLRSLSLLFGTTSPPIERPWHAHSQSCFFGSLSSWRLVEGSPLIRNFGRLLAGFCHGKQASPTNPLGIGGPNIEPLSLQGSNEGGPTCFGRLWAGLAHADGTVESHVSVWGRVNSLCACDSNSQREEVIWAAARSCVADQWVHGSNVWWWWRRLRVVCVCVLCVSMYFYFCLTYIQMYKYLFLYIYIYRYIIYISIYW